MYVHYAVTEQHAVPVIILYFINSSFIYFNSIIFLIVLYVSCCWYDL